ncbi:MAG: hypothetical protein CVV64_04785 [Candidatus Wallbacteria bacterium HGW-Wallbacteria-1]|jgi:hypothetical protein|uniref:Uncharacterized protein n=1 Tax=Candidatus Wallbacteria bacterium HGW-Wallbacteria-1 TaxID=2013854 RepID=A0A2N1PRX9_9BACT|nr:MAG: hypothetical protein CVV64_04785 [Candidatus Wallbacteria bacterium HGW-Wallbacteria-1]
MKFINQPMAQRHFDATNLEDLLLFRKAFDLESLDVKGIQAELKVHLDKVTDRSQENLIHAQTDFTFDILPRYYAPEKAKGWIANLLFKVEGVGDYTLKVDGHKATIEKGDQGVHTCTVKTDVTTLAMQLALVRIEDVKEDDELTDSDLEMVAGGKGGGCGAEASGASACGSDYSGAGACGAAACGGAACGAAACGAAACGGDACGAAGCAGAACGGAACGGAACGGDACGAAGCGGAACAAAACGGAACGGDACAAAACGAAIGCGVCAGNACGVDIQGGADVGPCAVNVCPGLPGI